MSKHGDVQLYDARMRRRIFESLSDVKSRKAYDSDSSEEKRAAEGVEGDDTASTRLPFDATRSYDGGSPQKDVITFRGAKMEESTGTLRMAVKSPEIECFKHSPPSEWGVSAIKKNAARLNEDLEECDLSAGMEPRVQVGNDEGVLKRVGHLRHVPKGG